MFRRFHRMCAIAAVVGLLSDLYSCHSAAAAEPQYATVAFLLPALGSDAIASILDNPSRIVFDGPDMGSNDSLGIENGLVWGAFSGADLILTDGRYINRGDGGGRVWGVNTLLPAHGVMLLGPHSDSQIELLAFAYLDGSVIRFEFEPEHATFVLVIVTGRVR
jgi:hypothetical protein